MVGYKKKSFAYNSPNDFIYVELHGYNQVVDRRGMGEADQIHCLL